MSASKDKGTRAETAVVRYLREHGFPHAERAPLRGANDQGDITGLPLWVIEVKAHKVPRWAAWMDELNREVLNATDGPYSSALRHCTNGVLIWKPPGWGYRRVEWWDAVMDMGDWFDFTESMQYEVRQTRAGALAVTPLWHWCELARGAD